MTFTEVVTQVYRNHLGLQSNNKKSRCPRNNGLVACYYGCFKRPSTANGGSVTWTLEHEGLALENLKEKYSEIILWAINYGTFWGPHCSTASRIWGT